ncbi:ABC transporter ATP-binding protein, partial [Bacillus pacificus]|nr:ABC transporter ATP-binding protein [Bacillus pacificus]
GVLLALMQVSNTIVGPCLAMLRHYNSLQSAKPILNKIEKLINTEGTSTNDQLLEGQIKSIEFQNASIGYENKEVLKDINLNIKFGEKVLIIGESGCGKSSLLNAIKGTAQIINGSLSINNENRLSLNNRSVLSKISLIQQNIFLFDDTFAKNITLGEDYEESEIIKACDQAGLLNVIEEKGLYFHVGENGKNISGGQQQRVEIARAFLRGRGLILIDEATSNLDKEKANEIRQTYLNMDQTVIEVAHYIDSQFVKCYDQIIVLSEGGIVEFGKADSLVISEDSYLNKVLLV